MGTEPERSMRTLASVEGGGRNTSSCSTAVEAAAPSLVEVADMADWPGEEKSWTSYTWEEETFLAHKPLPGVYIVKGHVLYT